MTDLTILCVTNHGAHSAPFLFRLAGLADGLGAGYVEHDGTDARVIEDVLDDAVASCPEGWILRMDDDEACSPEMIDWLDAGHYRAREHWAFPRLNLYPDVGSYIVSAHLYPDLQTRLSKKELSGGRHRVHQPSPFGTGEIAPVAIEHHKFLVRPEAERRALLEHYESVQPDAGRHFWQFSCPEALAGRGELELASRTAVAA